MNFSSCADIVSALCLEVDPNDMVLLRRTIRDEMAAIHPDKTGGDFPTVETKDRYLSLGSARDWLDSQGAHDSSIIRVSDMPAIVESIVRAQTVPVSTQLNQLRTECHEEQKRSASSRFSTQRIASGTIAAVCTLLFSFGGSLKDHPLLASIGDSTLFQIVVLIILFYALLFFALTWMRERREEGYASWLMSETGRTDSFREFCDEQPKRSSDNKVAISQSAYTHFLAKAQGRDRYLRNPSHLFSGGVKLSHAVADKIARMHLLELEQRGVLTRSSTQALESVYEVAIDLKSVFGKSEE